MEGKDESSNNSSINNTYVNCPIPSESRIGHNHPFYHCKEHPEYHNIHLKVIENHLILSKDHKKENAIEEEKQRW
jgi:hypothetical protein